MSVFESFVNTELPLRLSIAFPAAGNLTANELLQATGVGLNMKVVDTAIVIPVSISLTTIGLVDTNASHYLQLASGSDLTEDRILSFVTGDAARTVTLSGNPTLADWFDQSVKTTATPTFANMVITGTGIYKNTSDGSDTGVLSVGGGGAISSLRGGYINLCGNESVTAGGIEIIGGNVTP